MISCLIMVIEMMYYPKDWYNVHPNVFFTEEYRDHYGDYGPRSDGMEDNDEYYVFDPQTGKGKLSFSDDEINGMYFEDTIDLSVGVKVFAILSSLDYYGTDQYRINHIRTIEFTNVIDARDVQLKINGSTTNSITFLINTDNGQTSAANMLNQAFDENCAYEFEFKHEDTVINVGSAPSFSDRTITLVVNFDEERSLDREYSWESSLTIFNMGLIYRIKFTLTYDSDNSKWVIS